ncbi:MAG: hypothetical protein ACOX25_02665 [Caldicoprobacterales bacterium]|jgi:hypothetical protein|nr:hypothetical protein [Clostridiales bacterium]
MILEFIAVTGSGKTYLCNLLSTYLKEAFILEKILIYTADDLWKEMDKTKSAVINKFIRVFRRIHCVFSLPVMKLLLNILLSSGRWSEKKQKIIYYLSIINIYRIIRRMVNRNKSGDIAFILDEGIFHASEIFMDHSAANQPCELLSAYEKAVNRIQYIKYNDFKRIYIFVDSTICDNFGRLNNRPEGWPALMKNLSSEEKTQALAVFQAKVDQIKSYLSAGSSPCFSLDNTSWTNDFSDSFRKIKGIIHAERNLTAASDTRYRNE